MTVISALSLEYVHVPVVVDTDPTADVVQMAFVSSGSPAVDDWNAAVWTTTTDGGYTARCLVGPGGAVTMTPGSWRVFVKITDNPEVPVLLAGLLTVI